MAVYLDKTARSRYTLDLTHLSLSLKLFTYFRSFSEHIPILCGPILPLYVFPNG